MDESEDNMSSEDLKTLDSPSLVKSKPKKRSLVERELETSLTARVTSPVTNGDGSSTSRYGRARRLKSDNDFCETEKALTKVMKSPKFEKTPIKIQSPVYKMHASNSPIRTEAKKPRSIETNIENQIENIYNENIALSRFGSEEMKSSSPAKKFTKVYVRKDLIQKKEKEETITLIKNMFSPIKSTYKSTNTHLNNILERSSEKYALDSSINLNGHLTAPSVVKTLDFDGSKKKKDVKENKTVISKSELFDLEAKCEYQVGDLAWARVGTYPFWPCIVTRDPLSGMFVKKKLFGRVERDVLHVTFFGDNGRRGWIVDNMLRPYLGQLEFETTKEKFTAEAKKREPRLYAAFFISERKQPQWNVSVEEAEMLLREPKRLRIDMLNDMLEKFRSTKSTPKRERGGKITRSDSDVFLSESLYDSLFSEDDGKSDDYERSRSKSRNKSLDVSEVVTACLDNMAAKTGITKIQRQSHMDRWLQKAKSKTPEKSQPKAQVNIQRIEKESKVKNPKKKKKSPKVVQTNTLYSFRKFITESQTKIDNNLSPHQNEHDYSSQNSQDSESLSLTADETDSTAENEESIQKIPIEESVEDIVSNDTESLSNVVESKEENNTNDQGDVEMAVVNNDTVEVISATVNEVLDENTTREGMSEVEREEKSSDNESNKVFEEMDVSQSIENNVLTEDEEYAHLDFIMPSNNLDTNINNTVASDTEETKDIQGQDDNENSEISDEISDNCITERCSLENDSLHYDDENDESQDNNSTLLDAEELETENTDTDLYVLKDIDSKQTELNDNYTDKNDVVNCELFENNQNSEIEGIEFKEVCEEKKIVQNSTNDETKGDSSEKKEQIKNCNSTDDAKKEAIHSDDIVSEKNENQNILPELIQNNMEKHLHSDDVNMEMDVEQFQSNNLIVSENNVDELTEPKQNDLEEHPQNEPQDDVTKEADNEDLSKDDATADNLEETDQLNEQDNRTVSGLENSSEPTSESVENGFHENKENTPEMKFKEEFDPETASINSEDSEVSITKRRLRSKNGRLDVKKLDKLNTVKALQEPEFVKYMEFRQDALIEENPELTQDDIVAYLYKTWLYEEGMKSERKKTDDIEQLSLVKGLSQEIAPQPKKYRKKIKVEKEPISEGDESVHKDKPKRKTVKPYYNEDYSDIEEDLEYFEIFRKKNKEIIPKVKIEIEKLAIEQEQVDVNVVLSPDEVDEEEIYFEELTKPKPNLFKGLVREKVCEICERTGSLVKCKGCNSMFHVDCVKKEVEVIDVPAPTRGRKKKKKPRGRKPKGFEESNGEYESQSDEKSQDMNSEDVNMSVEEVEPESHIVADAENFEAQISAKMREMIDNADAIEYESLSSDDELDWSDTVVGKCKIVDIKLKSKNQNVADNYSDFKCNNCQKYDTPLCFVCKSTFSPKSKNEHRQRCQVPHCHKYYHMECLEHWPQTQFSSGEPSRNNKKINEHFEALTCPRHVCHTCVCDDPRGCKTRFSGDKLARCVKCPATYHSFTKCLPAGTQILTGSHIICPRHYEHRPGKVPCHVNTGWCFICALGGTLICCEYCPTSFHAECLNIKPPEGGYMCEDCETGRLPLYGEMVWVKLGHYRWWPGIILHPSEIPANIMAVKHSPGEFVVRFFGQYDHYWVNRGRVFPFQEGDSGKISSQKSKIDAAFTKAMEHAQRACEILKSVEPNQEESLDIASSLLPPHYVKLKVNKPCGSLCGRRVDVEANSHTQCECDPREEDPCGHNTQCLNRMLLTECGPTCQAGDRCNNRAFEKRLYPKLIPYRTPHRGWGLKTLEDIKKGQFVIEYVGELIDEEEFKRRMRRKHEVRDENFYFLTLDKERMIDAGPKGNLARFMNHCCEPNCETQKWTVLGDVRVGLFAINDIPANSELTFNYNLECAGIDKKRCLCGAKRCSGYIGAKPKQEESQPKKGKVAAKRTYRKRKNIEESPSVSKSKPKSRQTARSAKPRELTEIEKDLLIIKNATNGMSSDSECSGRLSSIESDRNQKALKRKRVSFSTEEIIIYNGSSSPSVKRLKLDDERCSSEVGD